MNWLQICGILAGAYFVGSIPTGYWLAKYWKGIDIRRQGSGNTGATNVYRVLGAKPALTVFLLDAAKGWLPVFLCQLAFRRLQILPLNPIVFLVAIGVSAILGHVFSVFLDFRGGKGVATSAGVFLALLPYSTLEALAVFALMLALTRIVSLSSLLAVLVLAVSSYFTAPAKSLILMTAFATVFIFWTHRANIRRLLDGTEPRVDLGKTA